MGKGSSLANMHTILHYYSNNSDSLLYSTNSDSFLHLTSVHQVPHLVIINRDCKLVDEQARKSVELAVTNTTAMQCYQDWLEVGCTKP